MSLADIVNVVITSNSRGVTRASFGIPLIIGKHDAWGERYRVYSAGTILPTLVTDGIPTTSPIYKAAQGLISNTPKVKNIAVGRLVTDYNQTIDLTVQATVTEGDIYAFDLRAPDGTLTEISYTAQTADTPTLVGTAVAALIAAVTDISATATLELIECVADNPNEMWQFENLNVQQFAFEDTTIDSSLVTELGEITTLYPSWYGLILADPNSNARVVALAANIETQERIFGITTFETDNLDPASETSTMYTLNAATYYRTYAIYSEDQNARAAATWMGSRFPVDPGASTWAYKALSGVTVDDITTNGQAAMDDVDGNYYITVGGLPVTLTGRMAGGEWIDAIRGRDWLTARLREAVFGLLANSPKVPFTDPGIDSVVSVVKGVLESGVVAGYLAADPPPIVTAPAAADVSDADKIARTLPDVSFEATLAGAIHIVDPLNGVLKV